MNKVGVGVGILLFDEKGKILLILRNSDKKLADSDMRLEGTYTLPSGKLLYGESFEDACCRKLQEEVGLVVKEENLRIISISTDINRYAHFVTIGMLAEKYSGQVTFEE